MENGNKKAAYGAGLVAVLLLGWWLFGRPSQSPVESVGLIGYTQASQPTGRGQAAVRFKVSGQATYLSLAVDSNGNGSFEPDEWEIKNVPVTPSAERPNTLGLRARLPLDRPVRLLAVTSTRPQDPTSPRGQKAEFTVSPATHEVGRLLDLGTVTNPEESMKGLPVVFAQTGQLAEGVDALDIDQRIAECAPTAAANGLYGLAKKNGQDGKLPKNPVEAIDQLKGDVRWTPAEGSLPDDFVKGKNEFAARAGLPIRTAKVGDKNGLTSLDEIKKALEGGGAAELRLKFSENGKFKGGHLVSVVGVREVDGRTFLDIHDPLTPAGTDTYELSGNVLDYAPYEFDTSLSWGFTQVWEGTQSGTQLEPMTAAEIEGIRKFAGQQKQIKVIIVQGKKVPIAQVHVGKGPECLFENGKEAPHYHANQGEVTALDGTVLKDPGGCGYGKVKDVPVEDVVVP